MTSEPVFERDPNKAARNLDSHGVSFESAAAFEFEKALLEDDRRRAYGETRTTALGLIRGRVHVLVYTERGHHIRVISLRKANDREVRRYARFPEQKDHDG